jgi:uncharacterized membrane protein YgcG
MLNTICVVLVLIPVAFVLVLHLIRPLAPRRRRAGAGYDDGPGISYPEPGSAGTHDASCGHGGDGGSSADGGGDCGGGGH